MSINTIDKWTSRRDFPGGRKGPWVESKVAVWRKVHGRAAVDDGAEGDVLGADEGRMLARDVATAKAAYERERARHLKLKNDQLEGKVIDRDEAVVEVTEMFARIRDRLLQLPDAVAVELPAESKPPVMAAIRRYLASMLNELAKLEEAAF